MGKGSLEDSEEAAPSEFKVYVGNLPFSAPKATLSNYFAECGKILSFDLLLTQEGKSRGIAFVTFADQAGLEAALERHGVEYSGRALKVSKAMGVGKREGSAKGKDGAALNAKGKGKGSSKGNEKGEGKDKGKGTSSAQLFKTIRSIRRRPSFRNFRREDQK